MAKDDCSFTSPELINKKPSAIGPWATRPGNPSGKKSRLASGGGHESAGALAAADAAGDSMRGGCFDCGLPVSKPWVKRCRQCNGWRMTERHRRMRALRAGILSVNAKLAQRGLKRLAS